MKTPTPGSDVRTDSNGLTRRGMLIVGAVVGVCFLVLAGLPLAYLHRLTDAAPSVRPTRDLLEPQRAAELESRIRNFQRRVQALQPAAPLELSAADLGLLVAEHAGNEPLAQRVRFEIGQERLRALASIRLGDLGSPLMQARYVNTEASLRLRIINGALWVELDELNLRGHPAPGWLVSRVRGRNLAAALQENPRTTLAFERIESIQIEQDRLVLIPCSGY